MHLKHSLSASAAALTAALIAAPAALAAEFPEGFPTISTPPGVKPTGEDTPLNLDTGGGVAAEQATGGGGLVRTIVGLAVVIAVIYGLAWVLKQVKSSKEARSAGTGLETLATVALGPNRALHLVRSGREIVLVGAAEHGVTPIRVYSMQEARELGLLDDESGDGPRELLTAEAYPELQPGEIPGPLRRLGPGEPDPEDRPKGPDFQSLVRRAQEWTVRG